MSKDKVKIERRKVRELCVSDRTPLLLFCYKSKPFRESNKLYDNVVEGYKTVLGSGKGKALSWFFTNVSKARRGGYTSMSVKLDNNYWNRNVAGIGIMMIREVLAHFEAEGFISVFTGNKDTRFSWLSFPSVVKFEKQLLDLFPKEVVRLHIPLEKVENTIVLKDRETKEEIQYEENETTNKMRIEMERYNDTFKDVKIEFEGVEIPTLEYKRSFSGNLFSGGRLFAHGGNIQLLPESYRLSGITLDGEKVVEIDYKAIHCFLLMEQVAHKHEWVFELAKNNTFDPYMPADNVIQTDEMTIAKHMVKYGLTKYNPVRNLNKVSMMMAINCDSEASARQSINHEIYKDSQLEESSRRYVGIIKPNAKDILDSLSDHNEIISDYFYIDYGILLQNVDSQIALRVIDYLVQEGQTCLAFHDSFAVKQSVAPLLERAMKLAWKDIMQTNEFCYIDKK